MMLFQSHFVFGTLLDYRVSWTSQQRDDEAAFHRYLELSRRGKTRMRLMAPLAVAGTTLMADDVTGVGVANDFLLPVVGLGLLATRLLTQAPAPETEVDKAWHGSSYLPPPDSLPGAPLRVREDG